MPIALNVLTIIEEVADKEAVVAVAVEIVIIPMMELVAPISVWKYVHPSDKDQTVEANGITFKFCAKYSYHKNV